MLDYEALDAVPILLPEHNNLNLYLVGCGGTGSWLAPSLVRITRLLQEQNRNVTLTFIDFDQVEAGNIPRQNFIDADLGLKKAEVLGLRYGSAWGVEIRVISKAFEPNWVDQGYRSLSIVIGCVDRATARQSIADLFTENYSTYYRNQSCWWLDCGNSATSGQILLGSTASQAEIVDGFPCAGKSKKPMACKALPAPHVQHPELLNPEPHELSAQPVSCRELAITNAQSLIINQRVAVEAAAFVNDLLLVKQLKVFAAYFDLKARSSKVRHISAASAIACFND